MDFSLQEGGTLYKGVLPVEVLFGHCHWHRVPLVPLALGATNEGMDGE